MIDAIYAASRYGLTFERLRLEAASHNVAIANTPNEAGAPASLWRVASHDAASMGAVTWQHRQAGAALVTSEASERKVHDPSDPLADKDGMVSYPKVDLVEEMSTLVDASRAYEANVRAFNALRSMDLRALDIGSGA